MPLEKDDDFYYSFLIGLFVRESSVSKINNIKRIVDILTDDYKLTKQDILILLSNISLTDQNITTLLDKLPIIPQSSLDVLIYSLRTNIKSSPKLAITFTKVDGNNNNIILPINGINRSKPVSVSYIKNGTSIKLDNIGNNLTIDDPFSYNSGSVTVFIESGDFTHLGYTEETADSSAFFQSSKLSGISNFNLKPQSVTNLSLLFYLSTFNQDVGNWDVSGCTNMYGMFAGAINFVGTGIGAWNVSGCKSMAGMFNGATVFNGNVEGWERPADGVIEKSTVRNVESMNFMFFDAEKFEGTNIGAWNVSGCTDMSSMFNGALLFNGNVEGWERPADGVIEKSTVSNVESMDGMFDRAKIFVGTGIGAWNVSGCKSMADMFSGASVFNGNVEGWERPANETGIEKSTVSNVVSMLGMFAGAINFVGTGIGAWNVSGCKDMSGMFNGALLFNENVEGWERPADGENGIDKSTVINVESMDFMFSGAKIFVGTGIGAWNVSGCTDMSSMFNGALLFNGNIEGWERPANETGDIEKTTVSSVENMNNMFTFATSFNSIISNWDVSSCTTMAGMFNGATAFNNGSTGSSADGRNSLLNSEFDTTNNSVTTFTDFATGAKLIEDLGGSEITAFYNVLFINTQ